MIARNAVTNPTREALLVGLMLAAIALLVTLSGALVRIDLLLYDIGQRANWREPPDDVVIISIDQESLDRMGRWPWSRDVHARLIDLVCAQNPAALGLDIAFVEPAANPRDDHALARAISRCGKVVLPVVIETASLGGQIIETSPLPEIRQAAAGMGRVGVHLEEDGIARTVDLLEGVGKSSWPLFAMELLRVAGQTPPTEVLPQDKPGGAPNELWRSKNRGINFIGPPGSVQHVSYAQVIAGDVAAHAFSGKLVLVGATAIGLGDFLPTPVSARGLPMPGVEVLANTLLTIREGRLIRRASDVTVRTGSVLLALAPLLWLPRMMALSGLLACLVWLLTLAGVCAFLPNFSQLWFSPTGPLIAGLAAFPLWSWRRLEAARRHLNIELEHLRTILPRRANAALPNSAFQRMGFERRNKPRQSSSAKPAASFSRMGFEQRISWVQDAQKTMQDFEMLRQETLAFISHDMRAPLMNAILYLENTPAPDREQLLLTLRRTHGMAQAFLSMARAEMLTASQMHELDLGSVLHQAVDQVYSLAQGKALKLVRELPDEPLWINGDFTLLERAAINFLQNAVTHSPEGGSITVGTARVAGEIRFWVDNEGRPLPEKTVARLFQRLSRGDAARAGQDSTGLGLYFVRLVAEKHGGTVGVDCSRIGKVRFWASIAPLEEAEGSNRL